MFLSFICEEVGGFLGDRNLVLVIPRNDGFVYSLPDIILTVRACYTQMNLVLALLQLHRRLISYDNLDKHCGET